MLIDANVLVYAFREDSPFFSQASSWLEKTVNQSRFTVTDETLAAFLRIVTHPRVFHPPSPLGLAFEFADVIRSAPGFFAVEKSGAFWERYKQISLTAGASGKLVPDAYLAAVALDAGLELVSTDRDFARFKGLRWRHPWG